VSVYKKIAQLGIMLPEVTPPVAAFVPLSVAAIRSSCQGILPRRTESRGSGSLGRNLAVAPLSWPGLL
jgi:hypothetical protein